MKKLLLDNRAFILILLGMAFFRTLHQDLVIGKVTRLLLSVAEERSWLDAPLTELK